MNFRAYYEDGHHRNFGIKFAELPTKDEALEVAYHRLTSPDSWRAHYGQKSDPDDTGSRLFSVEITGVVRPATRKG